jgi:hypothetical protein
MNGQLLLWVVKYMSWMVNYCHEWSNTSHEWSITAMSGQIHVMNGQLLLWVVKYMSWMVNYCHEWSNTSHEWSITAISGQIHLMNGEAHASSNHWLAPSRAHWFPRTFLGTTLCSVAPTARMHDWGGLMIALQVTRNKSSQFLTYFARSQSKFFARSQSKFFRAKPKQVLSREAKARYSAYIHTHKPYCC